MSAPESSTPSPFDYLSGTPAGGPLSAPIGNLPLVGYKVLRVFGHANPRLVSQNNFGDIWQPGWNQGFCAPAAQGRAIHPRSHIPERDCHCGFSVWASLAQAEAHQQTHPAFVSALGYTPSPSLIAIVIGTGNLEIHHGEGWRSQYAKIVGLVVTTPAHYSDLGEIYQATLISPARADQLAAEFGELAPPDPRQPELITWELCQKTTRALYQANQEFAGAAPLGQYFQRPSYLPLAHHLDLLLYSATLLRRATLQTVRTWLAEADGGLNSAITVLADLVEAQLANQRLDSEEYLLASYLLPDPKELSAAIAFALCLDRIWSDPNYARAQATLIAHNRAALAGLGHPTARPLAAINTWLAGKPTPGLPASAALPAVPLVGLFHLVNLSLPGSI